MNTARPIQHRILATCLASMSVLAGGSAGAGSLGARSRTPLPPPLDSLVAEAALNSGLPAAWIAAVMRVESGGNARAVSPKGAMGLMQIMPATWSVLRLRYRLGADPFGPRDNLLAGAAYLRELYDRYGPSGFLAAYNAGPGRYEKASRLVQPLPRETVAYVAQLQPVISGAGAPNLIPNALRPVSWRFAPLFTGRPSSVPVSTASPLHPAASVAFTAATRGLFVTAGQ